VREGEKVRKVKEVNERNEWRETVAETAVIACPYGRV
jgi:hypothetical protein